MINRVFIVIFILLLSVSCENNDTLTSFALNNEKIEDSNENLNIKNESFLEAIYIQAEKNDELIDRKETAKKVHAIGIDLYEYIEDLKIAIKKKNTTRFVDELFFNGDEITSEGKEFLVYIKNYRESIYTTLNNSNPRIVGMVNNNFNLTVIEDRRGQKTNWLNLNFKGLPPIISIIKLSTMQADIRRIETQYLAELLGVKLKSKSQKAIDKITTATDKQISENSKQNLDSKKDKILDLDKTSIKEDIVVKRKKEDEINIYDNIDKKEVLAKVVKKKEPKKIVPKATKITPNKVAATKKTHTVKAGENLYRISLKYKISLKKLKKINGMTNNSVVKGQVLKVE